MLTVDALTKLLHYDEDTGAFSRLITAGGQTRGARAGSLDAEGYRVISVHGARYKAHRLAYFYMTGKWPRCQVDHINMIHDGNRWSNLREATNGENHQNIRTHRSGSSSQTLGASWHRNIGKWQAQIQSDNKKVCLGYFSTKQQAHAAYMKAKKAFHPFGEIAKVA